MITYRNATPSFHRSVEANGFVFVSGMTASDYSLGMEGQTEQCLARIEAQLKEAGTDKTKIVMSTIYIADFAKKAEMDAAWRKWLPEAHLSARATVGVSDLGKDVLVEIVVTAVKRL